MYTVQLRKLGLDRGIENFSNEEMKLYLDNLPEDDQWWTGPKEVKPSDDKKKN